MYYKIPLAFENIFQGKNLPSCSLGESIAQHIQLMIETRYGEHQGDMNFGCEIWNFDFQLMVNLDDYEQKIRGSLLRAIEKYERRLNQVDVNIKISDEEVYNTVSGNKEMKKQAAITVNALIKETAEAFYFRTEFHLNPIISV